MQFGAGAFCAAFFAASVPLFVPLVRRFFAPLVSRFSSLLVRGFFSRWGAADCAAFLRGRAGNAPAADGTL